MGARIGAEDDCGADREPHHLVAEERDPGDRQRHRDQQQPGHARPGASGEGAVELQAGAEQGDDQGELADPLDQLGILDGFSHSRPISSIASAATAPSPR